ncbi:hypothetical protein BC834DRAFT_360657 [Gloeopeniophorella convolvens]|nr:hypothetical protein BC834DRAFT_360657 [Gloeopeniophorella convolvens]
MSSIGSNNGSSKKVPGVLWDDLGATNFVTSGAGPSKSKSTDHNAKRKALVDKMRQSSDDELDFLSSGSLSEDADVAASKKERKSKKQHSEKVIVDGQELTYHPNFFPQRKLPDFKKKKDSTAAEEQSSSASRTPKPSKIAKQYSVLAALHNNENTILSASSSDAGHVEDVFPQSGRKIRNFPGLTLSPLRADKQEKSRPDKSHREGEKKTTASASKLSRSSKTSSDKSDADSRRALPSRKPSRITKRVKTRRRQEC